MSDQQKKPTSKFHTFAMDLEAEREKRTVGETIPDTKEPTVEPEPKPKEEVVMTPAPGRPVIHIPKKPAPSAPKKSEPTVSSIAIPAAPVVHKIPSFHELQSQGEKPRTTPVIKEPKIVVKATNNHSAAKKKGASKTSDKKITYGGTIITDTKQNEFQFFPEALASVQRWFKAFQKSRKRKKPTYTVPDTDRRKGVIQTATSKSGTIFTADSDTLRQQIRRRRLQQNVNQEPETNWSPNTDTGYNLLAAPDSTQNVVVAFKKQARPEAEIEIPQPEPVAIPVPEVPPVVAIKEPLEIKEEPILSSFADVEAPVMETAPDIEIPTEISEVPDAPAAEEFETPEADEEEIITNYEELDELPDSEATQQSLAKKDTNTLTIIIVATIIAIVSIVFVAKTVIQNVMEARSSTEVVATTFASVLNGTTVVALPITPQTVNLLPSELTTATEAGTTEFQEFVFTDTSSRELGAPYLFQLLQFHTKPSLQQTVTSLRFVSYNQSEPIIVVRYTDEDTVRGDMLAWETTMGQEFSALYANAKTLTANATFTDTTIATVDVRMLTNDNGVVLVYGLTTDNVLVIAPTTEAFTQVVTTGFSR